MDAHDVELEGQERLLDRVHEKITRARRTFRATVEEDSEESDDDDDDEEDDEEDDEDVPEEDGSDWESDDDLFNPELSARDRLYGQFLRELAAAGEYFRRYGQRFY